MPAKAIERAPRQTGFEPQGVDVVGGADRGTVEDALAGKIAIIAGTLR